MNSDIPETDKDISESPELADSDPTASDPKSNEGELDEPAIADRDSQPGKPEARSGGSFLAFLAFMVSLAALAGTAWMWWQDQSDAGQEQESVFTEIARLESSDSELNSKLNQIRQEVDSLPLSDRSTEISALERRLENDVREIERLEQAVNEQLAISRSLQMAGDATRRRLQAAESALSGLATRELDAGGELDLAEVDYLLRLANERLKLFSDPVAADETLELADMHLAALDDPIFLSVRQEIAAARRDLAKLQLPDYFAISSELDTIQESVSGLPFKGHEAVAENPAGEDSDGWWGKLKGVFSGLVTVRHSTELEDQRISLEDMDYVRQRLWLQLEIAHLALMRRDQPAFRNALSRVEETLSAWFEESSSVFQAVKGRLDSLKTQEVQSEIPDISTPWTTLRRVRQLGGRPAAVRPPAELPEAASPSANTLEANTSEIEANDSDDSGGEPLPGDTQG